MDVVTTPTEATSVEHANTSSAPDAPVQSQSWPFPTNLVGFLIGKSGANIQRIEQSTGCKIQVSKDPKVDGPDGMYSFTYVRIRGDIRSIDRVKRIMMRIIMEKFNGNNMDTSWERRDGDDHPGY